MMSYHADNGEYPYGNEQTILTALTPSGRPYVQPDAIPVDGGSYPVDAWKQRIRISVDGSVVRVQSAGRDKRFGTSDDVLVF